MGTLLVLVCKSILVSPCGFLSREKTVVLAEAQSRFDAIG